ncbi:hypothetical protein FF1_042702 [Malus domestica]
MVPDARFVDREVKWKTRTGGREEEEGVSNQVAHVLLSLLQKLRGEATSSSKQAVRQRSAVRGARMRCWSLQTGDIVAQQQQAFTLRNFVKTCTPTQVTSHAQKYFLRRNNNNRQRRRSSLFDITTETISPTPMDEELVNFQDNASQSHHLPPPPLSNPRNASDFPMTVGPAALPAPIENPTENVALQQANHEDSALAKLVHPAALQSSHASSSFASFQAIYICMYVEV